MNSYRVCRVEHGVYFMGPVPIHDLCALMDEWSERYPIADALVGQHLGGSMALTNDSDAWRKALGIETRGDSTGGEQR